MEVEGLRHAPKKADGSFRIPDIPGQAGPTSSSPVIDSFEIFEPEPCTSLDCSISQ